MVVAIDGHCHDATCAYSGVNDIGLKQVRAQLYEQETAVIAAVSYILVLFSITQSLPIDYSFQTMLVMSF